MSGYASQFSNYKPSLGLNDNSWMGSNGVAPNANFNYSNNVPGGGAASGGGFDTTNKVGNGIYDTTLGKVGFGLQSAGSIFNAYNGYKQLGLAEDAFKFQKGLDQTNLANQANVTNEDMLNKQRLRLSAQGVRGDANVTQAQAYVDQHGVSGKI